MLKITALKPVRIYANVVTQVPVRVVDQIGYEPRNTRQWVMLKAGEVRDDISLVMGIHPSLLPSEPKQLMGTNLYVVKITPVTDDPKPQVFHDLLQVESVAK